jgi:hypothetical protein
MYMRAVLLPWLKGVGCGPLEQSNVPGLLREDSKKVQFFFIGTGCRVVVGLPAPCVAISGVRIQHVIRVLFS